MGIAPVGLLLRYLRAWYLAFGLRDLLCIGLLRVVRLRRGRRLWLSGQDGDAAANRVHDGNCRTLRLRRSRVCTRHRGGRRQAQELLLLGSRGSHGGKGLVRLGRARVDNQRLRERRLK